MTLGFCGVACVEGHVLSRGFPSQRKTNMAITMLLVPEMKHMGSHHVNIYAADVDPPPSCTASLKGPAVNSESDCQAGSLHDQLSRPITCTPRNPIWKLKTAMLKP